MPTSAVTDILDFDPGFKIGHDWFGHAPTIAGVHCVRQGRIVAPTIWDLMPHPESGGLLRPVRPGDPRHDVRHPFFVTFEKAGTGNEEGGG